MSVVQYRTPPNYNEALVQDGNTSASYYRFFQAVDQGVPPAAEYTVTVGPSPFTFTATQHAGDLYVFAGTVSQIAFMRSATYVLPWTDGVFHLSYGDSLIVTWSGAPTMIFVPQ